MPSAVQQLEAELAAVRRELERTSHQLTVTREALEDARQKLNQQGQPATSAAAAADSARSPADHERRRRQALLRRARLAELHADLALILARQQSLSTALQQACQLIGSRLQAAGVCLWLMDEHQLLKPVGEFPDEPAASAAEPRTIAVGQTAIGRIAADRQPLLSNAVATDPVLEDCSWARSIPAKSFVGCPLVAGDNVVGVIAMMFDRQLAGGMQQQAQRLADLIAELTRQPAETGTLPDRHLRLRKILDSVPAQIAYVDDQQRYVFVNSAYSQMFRRPESEIVGMTVCELLGEDNYRAVEPRLQAALRGQLQNYEFEMSLDQQVQPRINQVSYVPHVKADGRIAGCYVLVVDVTQRKQHELQLQHSAHQLQLVVDSVPARIAYIDDSQRYRFVNATYAPLLGRSTEEVLGRTVREVLGEENYQRMQPHIQAALAGEPQHYEAVLKLPNSDAVQMSEVSYIIDRDESGRVRGFYVMVIDVTRQKRQQLRIQQQKDELDAVYSTAPIGLCVLDRDGRYLRINERLARSNGIPAEAHIGHTVRELMPEAADHLEAQLKQIFETGQPLLDHEVRGTTPADPGREYVRSESWIPLFDSHGQVVAVNGVVEDVTHRHESERRIRESEQFLRKSLDSLFVFVGVCTVDGILIEANEQALKAGGVPAAEVLGRHFADTVWWNYDPQVQQELRDAMTQAASGQVSRYDVDIRVAGDKRLTIDFQMVPMLDDSGRVTHLIPSAIDVTDRRRNEQALRISEERLRIAARAAGFGTYDIHFRTNQVIWSDEMHEIFGWPQDAEAADRPRQLTDHVHPDDRAVVEQAMQNSTDPDGSGECAVDFRIIKPTGEVRWVRMKGKTLFTGSAGHRVARRAIGTILDITERKTVEAALLKARAAAESASQAKSEFLANMSHEIRTPMTAILGYADLLSNHLRDPDNLHCVDTIRRNGRFLIEIINDILDLSKIEAGKLEITTQEVSPEAVIKEVRSLMDVRAQEKQITLNVEVDGRVPELICTDATRLRQILVNLVGNAIKFTDTGTVSLIARALPQLQQMEFEIIDTGIGISPEQQRRLFQPFTQGDASITREFGGTGLGLTISRRLAEMLGGQISARSELEKGSTFTVTIDTGPIDQTAFVEAQLEDSRIYTSSWQFSPPPRLDARVLIVDDRREVRHLAQHFVEDAGGDVTVATNGQQAIDQLKALQAAGTPVDIVVMDIQMPVKDGYTATRELRQAGFDRPIIALTANAMQGDREACLTAGYDDYLTKPLDRRHLIDTLHRYTSKLTLQQICQRRTRSHVADPAGVSDIDSPSAISESNTSDATGLKILLVDDNYEAIQIQKMLLELHGHVVDTALTGKAAVAHVAQNIPDIVLLDLRLPDMDGFAVARQIREITAHRSPQLIALTGDSTTEARQQAKQAGIHRFLLKPVDVDELNSILRDRQRQP